MPKKIKTAPTDLSVSENTQGSSRNTITPHITITKGFKTVPISYQTRELAVSITVPIVLKENESLEQAVDETYKVWLEYITEILSEEFDKIHTNTTAKNIFV